MSGCVGFLGKFALTLRAYPVETALFVRKVSSFFQVLANSPEPTNVLDLPRSTPVGIELGRASGEVEGSHSRPFGCEMAAHFHQRHVFRGPPIMPDGGISPVRFEVLAFPL